MKKTVKSFKAQVNTESSRLFKRGLDFSILLLRTDHRVFY